jgi:hypothetical protein
MYIELELSPAIVAELESVAERMGLAVTELAQRLLDRQAIFFNS